MYAIPYEGEEVKLHWANHDQYYVKTSEYFKNYIFKIDGGKTVHFKLRDASTEQNNNKTQGNQERKFKLAEEDYLTEEGNHLTIWFSYEPVPKTTKQDDLIADALKAVKETMPATFQAGLLKKVPTEKQKDRTLLEKHLKDYVARNTFDYFIHKDLGGFLKRELDFYIKNEILVIDDINLDAPQSFDRQLRTIKAFKAVAQKISAMLAQLENFQKKLWLKKKFVLQSDWCITLDRIPEEFYPDIAANSAQRLEWVKLFAIDQIKADTTTPAYSAPLTVTFLKAHPFLVLDTQFFGTEWKYKLLGQLDQLDENCNGLMINSENFQALNILQDRFHQQVQTIYIDPPYNTAASEIAYKNNYKHSSWLSLMYDRIVLGKSTLKREGFSIETIDYFELFNLGTVSDLVFGEENRVGIVTVFINPKGRQHERFFSSSTEYMLVYANDEKKAAFVQTTIDEEKRKLFDLEDEKGHRYRLDNFARIRSSTTRSAKPNFYYPIYVSHDLGQITLTKEQGYLEVVPVNDDGIEYSWKLIPESFLENLKKNQYVAVKENGKLVIKNKFYEQQVFPNIWTDKKYFPEFQGTNLLKNIFGESRFDYPKSIYAVEDSLKVSAKSDGLVLDFFAGSGTSGHAVINLNRQDKGVRKFALVEMGEYFNTVTKPRIQKVIYSADWKDGKPLGRNGSSHAFKYLRLESYEDALNNLELKRSAAQQSLLGNGGFSEEYLLHYMLDVESRESLLNLDMFKKPFGYTIKVTENNELKEQEVDLVETFNYLIGLVVESMQLIRGTVVVQGKNLQGDKILVIWRDVEAMDNKALNEFFEKLAINTKDAEFKRIYVNGDNNIENLRNEDEQWKVMLIEEAFHKLMFDVKDV